jgi:hypothetical protein
MPFSMIDFQCSSVACTGKTERARAAFKELQKQLNRFGLNLVEDGAIGTNTVNAARSILQNQTLVKEGLATLADTFAAQLAKIPRPEFPISLPPAVVSDPPSVAPVLIAPQRSWGWALLAGAGVLAGIGSLIYLASRGDS